MDVYGETRSFILSVFTYWGTQLNMIELISRDREAFQELYEDARCELRPFLKTLLWDAGFRKDTLYINNILKPIHDIQYTLEKDGYKLRHVVRGWKQIHTHLIMWSVDTDTNVSAALG